MSETPEKKFVGALREILSQDTVLKKLDEIIND